VKSGRDSRKLLHSLPSHEMEPAKKIRESQELCHGSPEKFSQGVSTELVRPFFQNFKIPNWLSICLSVFHSITTSQTQRSVKYGQDRGEGPPFQRGTAALDPAGVALTLAPGREVRGEQSAKVARDLKSGATCDARTGGDARVSIRPARSRRPFGLQGSASVPSIQRTIDARPRS
jgi:hypothetical protein